MRSTYGTQTAIYISTCETTTHHQNNVTHTKCLPLVVAAVLLVPSSSLHSCALPHHLPTRGDSLVRMARLASPTESSLCPGCSGSPMMVTAMAQELATGSAGPSRMGDRTPMSDSVEVLAVVLATPPVVALVQAAESALGSMSTSTRTAGSTRGSALAEVAPRVRTTAA
jgi:hypothetical protein